MPDSVAMILVCSCGKRLKALGATPGRLGRCPDCGAAIRVPEMPPPMLKPPPKSPVEDPLADNRLSFEAVSDVQAARRLERLARERTESRTVAAAGWVFSPPKSPETSLAVSLLYPFWDWAGVGLLAFTPAILAGLTFLMVRLCGFLFFLNYFTAPAYVLFLGATVGLAIVLGHTCHHLGLFLIDSASGSPAHPSRPDFETFEALGFLVRWLWAAVLGFAFGGGTAFIYVFGLGDVVRFRDRLAIAGLLSLSAIAAPLAILAATLFHSVRAAGPLTVVGGLFRLRLAYARPCLVAAVAIAATTFLATYVLEIESVPVQAFVLWLFWRSFFTEPWCRFACSDCVNFVTAIDSVGRACATELYTTTPLLPKQRGTADARRQFSSYFHAPLHLFSISSSRLAVPRQKRCKIQDARFKKTGYNQMINNNALEFILSINSV